MYCYKAFTFYNCSHCILPECDLIFFFTHVFWGFQNHNIFFLSFVNMSHQGRCVCGCGGRGCWWRYIDLDLLVCLSICLYKVYLNSSFDTTWWFSSQTSDIYSVQSLVVHIFTSFWFVFSSVIAFYGLIDQWFCPDNSSNTTWCNTTKLTGLFSAMPSCTCLAFSSSLIFNKVIALNAVNLKMGLSWQTTPLGHF